MGNFKDLKRYLEDKNIKEEVISYLKSKGNMLSKKYSKVLSSVTGFVKKNSKKALRAVATLGAVAIIGATATGCGTTVNTLEGHNSNCKGGEVKSWGTPIGVLYCNCQNKNENLNKPVEGPQSSQSNNGWEDHDWANIIPGEKAEVVVEDKKPASTTTQQIEPIIQGAGGEIHVGNSVPTTKKEDVKPETKKTESSELVISGEGGETHIGSSVPETKKEDVKAETEKAEEDFGFDMEAVN